MLANITEVLFNYYNKIETVGSGKISRNSRTFRRAHMGDEERVRLGRESNASLNCSKKY